MWTYSGKNRNKNRQTRLILCSAAVDKVKREVRIISPVSYYLSFFSNIIKSHIIWQALVPFLLLTLLLLGYNQETITYIRSVAIIIR